MSLLQGDESMNSTPSGSMWQWRRSSFVSAETRSGQVKENNIASFHDNCLRDSDFPGVGVSRSRGAIVEHPLKKLND